MPPARSATASAYLFLAARASGGRTFGMRRARDQRQLTEILRRERLVPLRAWRLPGVSSRDGRLSLADQAEFNMQLAQLLGRGVPLVEALEVTVSSVSDAASPRMDRMRELVAGGSSFADACRSVAAFDPVTIAVYRGAERTGDLPGAARQLAVTARRLLNVRGKAVTLMIYPAIVLTIAVAVAVLMLTVIVPMIGNSLRSSGAELPWFTEAVIGAGLFIRGYALLLLAVLAGAVFAVVSLRGALARLLARAARRTPLLREVVLAQETTRFFSVMAAMTRSGVTLADALGVAVGAIGHPTLRREIAALRTRLIEGGVLRALIDTVKTLPLGTRRLLTAAERAGDLETAFDSLASDMADEVEKRSARLLAALEPLLILVMFVMIGTLLLSVMLPLMSSVSKMI